VPVSAFAGASPTDFVWFYNLNGVHFAAHAGYEEWSAYTRVATAVPDRGDTLKLLLIAIVGICLSARRLRRAKAR
jgi:hypothetical protein